VETSDFETWTGSKSPGVAPDPQLSARDWRRMTEYRGESILGAPPIDAAVSPVDSDDLVVANARGIWRSLDGGKSWDSLNAGLTNFPGRRILSTPQGRLGIRVLIDDTSEAAWMPGERTAWRITPSQQAAVERALKAALTDSLGAPPDRVAASGGMIYALAGRTLWASGDAAATWRQFNVPTIASPSVASEAAIFVLPGNAQVALAAVPGEAGGRIFRTVNGGIFWDDLTSNLAQGAVAGLTADPETGAIYAATSAGLFYTRASLLAAAAASAWTRIPTEANAKVLDVALGSEGNQLWILLEGLGMRRTLAPHRSLAPKLVSSADGISRAVAPGSLLTFIGSKVSSATAGELAAPVLAATEGESQVQVPFGVQGNSVTLTFAGGPSSGSRQTVDLRQASPAIFTDQDGTPLVIDAEYGVFIDQSHPARAGASVQILAAGLGRVTPDWPTGLAAPSQAPPKVVAPVRVWLDRTPVEVLRATLAPGYVGFYIVEVQLPALVNSGPNELYLETAGTASNRVTLHLAQ
jgi:uncharacterized protein (TIGR03437 family)